MSRPRPNAAARPISASRFGRPASSAATPWRRPLASTPTPIDRNEIRLDCNVTPSDACHETTALSFPPDPDASRVSRKTLGLQPNQSATKRGEPTNLGDNPRITYTTRQATGPGSHRRTTAMTCTNALATADNRALCELGLAAPVTTTCHCEFPAGINPSSICGREVGLEALVTL